MLNPTSKTFFSLSHIGKFKPPKTFSWNKLLLTLQISIRDNVSVGRKHQRFSLLINSEWSLQGDGPFWITNDHVLDCQDALPQIPAEKLKQTHKNEARTGGIMSQHQSSESGLKLLNWLKSWKSQWLIAKVTTGHCSDLLWVECFILLWVECFIIRVHMLINGHYTPQCIGQAYAFPTVCYFSTNLHGFSFLCHSAICCNVTEISM